MRGKFLPSTRNSQLDRLVLPAVFERLAPLRILALIVGFGSLATLYGGWRAFYFQSSFLAPIAYITDERPTANLFATLLGDTPDSLLTGIHVFHDFGVSYYWGTLSNPWVENEMNFWPNHSPLAMLLGRFWQNFDYLVASQLNVLVMAVLMLIPIVIATLRRPWHIKVLALAAVLLSGPFIATLDRGNYQGFIPVLLFGFGYFALKGRWGWAAGMLVIAASLKVYPIILILVLIAERRWRATFATVVGGFAGNVVMLFAFSGPITETARMYFLEAGKILGLPDLLSYNISFVGGVLHWLQFYGASGAVGLLSSQPSFLVAVGFLLIAPIVWMRRSVPLVIRIVVAFFLTTLATPIVFPYTANWAIAALALVLMTSESEHQPLMHSDRGSAATKPQVVAVSLAVSMVLAFTPVFIPGTVEGGYPAGAQSLVAPVVAILFAVTMWWSHFRTRPRGLDRAMGVRAETAAQPPLD